MTGYWWNLVLVAALILANAVFAGSEMALVSLRESQLRSLERRPSKSVQALIRLARDPNRFLATIQIAITLSGYLASATAAVYLAQPLVPQLGFLGGAAEPVAVAAVTLCLVYVSLVIGELAPKRLAMQHPQRWALAVARPLDAFATAVKPVLWLLSRSTDLVVRLFRGDPRAARQSVSVEEIRDMVLRHRGLDSEQRTIISGALDIQERTLRQVLVHRSRVFSLPADTPVGRARTLLAESGHSRAPVVRSDNLDELIGVVHLRDLLDQDATVGDIAADPILLPESMAVSDALKRFRQARQKFAAVVEENGSVEGIVTVEDLLEEIVGEIYDEADRDFLSVRREADGSFVVPGSFPVHDLTDIAVVIDDAPEGPYVTIAGLAIAALGRIPRKPGDWIDFDAWTITVTRTGVRAITEVRISPRRARQRGPKPAGVE